MAAGVAVEVEDEVECFRQSRTPRVRRGRIGKLLRHTEHGSIKRARESHVAEQRFSSVVLCCRNGCVEVDTGLLREKGSVDRASVVLCRIEVRADWSVKRAPRHDSQRTPKVCQSLFTYDYI